MAEAKRNKKTYVVQFIVEAAGVADGLSVLVPSPEGCGCRLAVGATRTRPSCRTLEALQQKRTAINLLMTSKHTLYKVY